MSSKARLVITAVVVEKQPMAQVVRDYGVSRSWVYELLARYRTEGAAAFEPRSRRPHTSQRATGPETVELVLALHIGIGRSHAGTHILLLAHDHHVRVVHDATGELLRELDIDLTRDYQPRHPQDPK